MRLQQLIILFVGLLLNITVWAQHSPDFAEKFMTLCQGDTNVTCVTVSPKMMEQLVKHQDESHPNDMAQAFAKLKSARIVNGHTAHYQKAEQLLQKNKKRFKTDHEFRTEEQYGAFYTRKDRDGNTVEFIMLCAEPQQDRFTIINLTGDIDEEFLCFLYNKSIKN